MAHKKLTTVTNPQLWYQTQKSGLVEAVVVENFGSGPTFWRLWVPESKDQMKVQSAIIKRMASDHNIDLKGFTRLISDRNPINDLPMARL